MGAVDIHQTSQIVSISTDITIVAPDRAALFFPGFPLLTADIREASENHLFATPILFPVESQRSIDVPDSSWRNCYGDCACTAERFAFHRVLF